MVESEGEESIIPGTIATLAIDIEQEEPVVIHEIGETDETVSVQMVATGSSVPEALRVLANRYERGEAEFFTADLRDQFEQFHDQ